jgi:lipopolysaccharide transport system ATP-binding protein
MYQDVTDDSAQSTPQKSDPSIKKIEKPESNKHAGYISVSPDNQQFGNGDVTIEKVGLASNENSTGVAKAGQPCSIGFIFFAHKKIERPLAGFTVKDRFGRVIMADNTAFMNIELPCMNKDQRYEVEFLIEKWPNLKEEDYTLSVALGDGTEEDHVQCHLIFDIISFKNISAKKTTSFFSLMETRVLLSEME